DGRRTAGRRAGCGALRRCRAVNSGLSKPSRMSACRKSSDHCASLGLCSSPARWSPSRSSAPACSGFITARPCSSKRSVPALPLALANGKPLVKANTSRVMLLLAAFLGGPFLFFFVTLWVAGRAPSPVGSAIAAVGGPFRLEDQNGKPFTDQDMKGRPFLVFFGFTHCPDICPATLFEISQMLHTLGPDADRTGALFITVDPERDTPTVIKDYL